jgi:hypothetical protein
MVHQVSHIPHMVPGVVFLEVDPAPGKDIVVGEINAQEQSYTEDGSHCQTAFGS